MKSPLIRSYLLLFQGDFTEAFQREWTEECMKSDHPNVPICPEKGVLRTESRDAEQDVQDLEIVSQQLNEMTTNNRRTKNSRRRTKNSRRAHACARKRRYSPMALKCVWITCPKGTCRTKRDFCGKKACHGK